jgi:hypothetical protein
VELLADRRATSEPHPEIDDTAATRNNERGQHPHDNDLGNLCRHRQRIGVTHHQTRRGAIEDPVDSLVEFQIRGGLGCPAPHRKLGDRVMQRLRECRGLTIQIPRDGS